MILANLRCCMAFVLLLCATLIARGDEPPAETDDATPAQPPVQYVDDDDPAMQAAVTKARKTVDQFIKALEKPRPSQEAFAVKVLVVDGPRREHLWISPIRFRDGQFVGRVNNQPDQVRNVKLGQTVAVQPEKISDWMYVEQQRLVGGYTIRVLYEAMTPAEQREFSQSVPFSLR